MSSTPGNRGASLVEVLVALTLFSIVATGLTATSVATTSSNTVSKILAAGSALVQDKVEELRSLDPALNPPDLDEGGHADPMNPIAASGAPGGRFIRAWVVTPDVPGRGVARVVVAVTWDGPSSHTVTGVTYVCTNRTCS